MLVFFKAKNYMSFKDEVMLDMRATSYKQHMNHILQSSNNMNLIKTAAIFGANASGKSNLISAMFFFEKYVFAQFISEKGDKDIFFAEKNDIRLDPFRLSEKKDNVTEFEIAFVFNEKLFQYGFECTADQIVSEWYLIDDKVVFERQDTKLKYGSKYREHIDVFSKVPKERLYLSVLDYFIEEDERELVLEDFFKFFQNDYTVYLELFFESSVKSLAGGIHLSNALDKDKEIKKKVEEYIKRIDVGIDGIEIDEKTIVNEKTGEEKKRKIIKTYHKVYNENNEPTGTIKFNIEMESSGTIRFFNYIQHIVRIIDKGGVFIVDELSARMHPLLTKLIVDMFQSSYNEKAQLIFTTHDITMLNRDQFRRDEIIFVEKNQKGESTLSALSDFKVREDATFNKDYLNGKYGAIPVIDYDFLFGGDMFAKS